MAVFWFLGGKKNNFKSNIFSFCFVLFCFNIYEVFVILFHDSQILHRGRLSEWGYSFHFTSCILVYFYSRLLGCTPFTIVSYNLMWYLPPFISNRILWYLTFYCLFQALSTVSWLVLKTIFFTYNRFVIDGYHISELHNFCR